MRLPNGSADAAARAVIVLQTAFVRTILHTNRSKFTQYILFYVCARSSPPPPLLPPLYHPCTRNAPHPTAQAQTLLAAPGLAALPSCAEQRTAMSATLRHRRVSCSAMHAHPHQ